MSIHHPIVFAELVREYRLALGWTQEELAERAGVSPRGVRALEAGERRVPQRETVRLLAEALGLEGEERQRFETAARSHGSPTAEHSQPAGPHPPQPHPTNLPDEPTPFIGREGEIAHVAALLQKPQVRLLTLTGPGGTGKTRLALEVGSALLHHFPDGVFFVNLASLTDPALVPSAVAEVLAVMEEPGKDLVASLADALRAKHLLLILDNFEHLLPAASVVARLLDLCRELDVLVTSRVPLHLHREHRHAVPPLAVPDPANLPGLASLAQCEAVALFIERARAANDSFALTMENAAAVAAICVRLDGLPLAIELAAARTKLFPPNALLPRLSNRLKLLTGGAHDLPERQRTLRGAIDWSYSLLEAGEQTLFARLSIFAGGCTLEAAERVCNADGDLPLDSVEGVTSLLEKGLLQQVAEGEPRLTMLETIREYAAEMLSGRDETEVLRIAHAAVFRQFAGEAEPELSGPLQGEWLSRLEAELGNLRLALQTFLDRGEIEEELRMAASLHRFWDYRGYWSEGRRWLEAGLARGAAIAAGARADALTSLGVLAQRQGDYERAVTVLEEGLALWRAADDRRGSARALLIFGNVVKERGQYQEATALFEQSLQLSQEAGDRAHSVSALGNLGLMAAHQGDLVTARERFEKALDLARELGDKRLRAVTLQNLADIALQMGGLAEASARLEEARPLAEEIGDKYCLAYVLETLAEVQRKQGRTEQAHANLQHSMRLARDLGGLTLLLILFGEMAVLAVAEGDPARAALLRGAEDAQRARLGMPCPLEDQAERDAVRDQARTMLGEDVFTLMSARGGGMNLEEAIAFALGETSLALSMLM
jgi:predicted ATPase/DNA-binding XRE family transcriptional regulator